ncbi:MAG: glycosyltransferase family 25 protein [Roseateles sp.]|nr:MAG: glycosyltransferase family 25 protein [Roseateles sp.]
MPTMPSNTHAWVINLDRSPERLAVISAQLDALGLPWTRHRAVDARALRPDQSALLDLPEFHRKHGMEPVPGEIGCYLSHIEVMQAFLASPHRFALILEDDANLGPRLPPVLAELEACAERWDMVKLSAVHSGSPQTCLRLDDQCELAIMMSRCTGSSAYLISRHAAEVYLSKLLPMSVPYDHAFDRGWALGLKIRLVTPPPVGHPQDNATTIITSGRRKFHWTRRWTTHLYRARNEIARIWWGLVELRQERAYKNKA